MAKTLTSLNIEGLQFKESAAPATPASGFGRLYVDTSGRLNFVDDAGVTFPIIGTAAAITLAAATSFIVPIAAAAAPTADGSIAYASTQERWVAGGHVAQTGSFPRVLSVQRSTTDTITDDAAGGVNTAFATTYAVPANFFIAGKVLRVTAPIELRTNAGPPNITISIQLGATAVITFGTLAPTASVTRGYQATAIMQGTAAAGASVAVLMAGLSNLGAITSSYTVNLATNGALTLAVYALWASNAANTHTAHLTQLLVEEQN